MFELMFSRGAWTGTKLWLFSDNIRVLLSSLTDFSGIVEKKGGGGPGLPMPPKKGGMNWPPLNLCYCMNGGIG